MSAKGRMLAMLATLINNKMVDESLGEKPSGHLQALKNLKNELERAAVMDGPIITVSRYWECGCKGDFLHPKDKDFCDGCDLHADECRDARIEDVIAAGLPFRFPEDTSRAAETAPAADEEPIDPIKLLEAELKTYGINQQECKRLIGKDPWDYNKHYEMELWHNIARATGKPFEEWVKINVRSKMDNFKKNFRPHTVVIPFKIYADIRENQLTQAENVVKR